MTSALQLGVFLLGYGLAQVIARSLIYRSMKKFHEKWRRRAIAGKCSPTLTAHILNRPVVWRD